ncbi:MAG: RelA/SpoT family protein [Oscillospiraceae bacterium]|nr:RelA/SpoT family protein [Oscillospiraceae bacterium]
MPDEIEKLPKKNPMLEENPEKAAIKAESDAAWLPLRERLKKTDGQNLADLDKAYNVALEHHGLERRRDGKPFITHPIAVAEILLDMGMDSPAIAAAILHDVAEDTKFGIDSIKKEFGSEIALLVDGVTKLKKARKETKGDIHSQTMEKEELQALSITKMLNAMNSDIRVILIKLADRLHNIRTLQFMSQYKHRTIARETLQIYAPIAHRIGLRWIKEELEDTSLRFLDPLSYKEIGEYVDRTFKEKETLLKEVQEKVWESVKNLCKTAVVSGRVKSKYAIYRKTIAQNRRIDSIFDIFAIRILVNKKDECLSAIGCVYDVYPTYINERYKDYLHKPKENGYQSLHTVIVVDGTPIEIQVRTKEMQHIAEYGIAAHWKYKLKNKDGGTVNIDHQLKWLRKLLEAQQEGVEADELVETIKTDFVPEVISVLTPRGDSINLPRGATVIDFAYAIHTGVAERMIGATMNGEIVPLNKKLTTGAVVSILTSAPPGKGPSRSWLSIAKTNSARSKIKAWFKREQREENIACGREELERELRRVHISFSDADMEQILKAAAKRQRLSSVDDFLAALGYGGIPVANVMPFFKDEAHKIHLRNNPPDDTITIDTRATKKKRSQFGVIVEDMDDVLLKLANCCTPIPGDEIIGFITRGHGVSIHTVSCKNVSEARRAQEPERWLKAHWETKESDRFEVTFLLEYNDRMGFLRDVSELCTKMNIPITDFAKRGSVKDVHRMSLKVVMNVKEQYDWLLTRMKEIKGMIGVARFQE